ARHALDFAAICGWSRLLYTQRATRSVLDRHPRTPHYYLFLLGVDPAAQGRGIGRALVAPILERCDRDGVAAYLETSAERNLALYRSLGFDVTGEIDLRRGPKVWLMLRAARGARP